MCSVEMRSRSRAEAMPSAHCGPRWGICDSFSNQQVTMTCFSSKIESVSSSASPTRLEAHVLDVGEHTSFCKDASVLLIWDPHCDCCTRRGRSGGDDVVNFPPEVQAVWHAAPNLTLCPKFRHRGFDQVLAHIKKDNCERCRAAWRQLNEKCALISVSVPEDGSLYSPGKFVT